MGRVDAATKGATIRVAIACSPRAGEAFEVEVELDSEAIALDAIRASGLLERFAEIDVSVQSIGIWGRVRSLHSRLADGDRIEIYRPLAMNPKDARRLRAARK